MMKKVDIFNHLLLGIARMIVNKLFPDIQYCVRLFYIYRLKQCKSVVKACINFCWTSIHILAQMVKNVCFYSHYLTEYYVFRNR